MLKCKQPCEIVGFLRYRLLRLGIFIIDADILEGRY